MKYITGHLFIFAIFSGFSFIFLSCQNPPGKPQNTAQDSIQNIPVTGLSAGEKVTAVTQSGRLIDINPDGRLYLSGTSFPAEITGMPEVVNQPGNKTCSILPEVRDHAGDGNLRWVMVCSFIKYYSLGGILTGLTGKNVKLQLNNEKPVVLTRNGIFTISQALAEKTPYDIKLIGQPQNPDQLCAVNRGKGILEKPVFDVEVVCSSHVYKLEGSISGQKSGLVLANSNGDTVDINRNDTAFSFSQFIPAGAGYSLEVQTQPYGQECYILNNHGIKINRHVRDVKIVCNDFVSLPVTPALSQSDKSLINSGKYLHVWFYLDRRQVVYPTLKKSMVYKEGSVLNFSVAKGTWYIRAFIDIDEDQKPGIGADFQSRLLKWEANDNHNGAASTLLVPIENTFQDSGYQTFNAYMLNTSEWRQPRGGKCGGSYMKLESVNFRGNSNHLSPVYAILPDETTIELLDDGGCGDSFNNNASSYDRQSKDGEVSAGIDRSYGIQSGTYTFYYVNYVSDKIHIVEDSLAGVYPLSSFIYLLNPTGAAPVQTPNPVFQWNPVAGASSYEILLESTDHLINNYADMRRFVKTSSYVAPFDLQDRKSYKVNIQAFDTDISANTNNEFRDFDAVSQSPDQFFITDFSGNNSVRVGGKLTNLSGRGGSYLIYGDSNTETGSWESGVFLPPDSSTYSLALFKNSGKFGALISGINVDESGYVFSNTNRAYVRWNHSLFLNGNLELDLTWNKPLLLAEPVSNDRGLGEYPAFSWDDYTPADLRKWSYLLWITPYNSHGAPRLIGLENNRFDFSHVNLSPYLNLTGLYQCSLDKDNSTPKFSTCGYNDENIQPGGLKEQTDWEWKVMVVPCNFEEYKNGVDNDTNGRSDYIDCVLKTFSGQTQPVTESVSSFFSTY